MSDTAPSGSILDSASSAQTFFFNDTATTEIYTLSLHDALTISLVTTLSTLSASAGSGGVNILNDAGLTVDTVSGWVANTNAHQSPMTIATRLASDMMTSSNGNIVLQTVNGNLTHNDGVGGDDTS